MDIDPPIRIKSLPERPPATQEPQPKRARTTDQSEPTHQAATVAELRLFQTSAVYAVLSPNPHIDSVAIDLQDEAGHSYTLRTRGPKPKYSSDSSDLLDLSSRSSSNSSHEDSDDEEGVHTLPQSLSTPLAVPPPPPPAGSNSAGPGTLEYLKSWDDAKLNSVVGLIKRESAASTRVFTDDGVEATPAAAQAFLDDVLALYRPFLSDAPNSSGSSVSFEVLQIKSALGNDVFAAVNLFLKGMANTSVVRNEGPVAPGPGIGRSRGRKGTKWLYKNCRIEPLKKEALRRWPSGRATSRYEGQGFERTREGIMEHPQLVEFFADAVQEIATSYEQIGDLTLKLRLNREGFWETFQPLIVGIPELEVITTASSMSNIFGTWEEKGLGITEELESLGLDLVLRRGREKVHAEGDDKDNDNDNDNEQKVTSTLSRIDCYRYLRMFRRQVDRSHDDPSVNALMNFEVTHRQFAAASTGRGLSDPLLRIAPPAAGHALSEETSWKFLDSTDTIECPPPITALHRLEDVIVREFGASLDTVFESSAHLSSAEMASSTERAADFLLNPNLQAVKPKDAEAGGDSVTRLSQFDGAWKSQHFAYHPRPGTGLPSDAEQLSADLEKAAADAELMFQPLSSQQEKPVAHQTEAVPPETKSLDQIFDDVVRIVKEDSKKLADVSASEIRRRRLAALALADQLEYIEYTQLFSFRVGGAVWTRVKARLWIHRKTLELILPKLIKLCFQTAFLALIFPTAGIPASFFDSRISQLYRDLAADSSSQRQVQTVLDSIYTDMHGVVMNFELASTKDTGDVQDLSIQKGYLGPHPMHYVHKLKQQGGICYMHLVCNRALYYEPTQGRDDNANSRKISVGAADRRNRSHALLNDGLPKFVSYACPYMAFRYNYQAGLATGMSRYYVLFHTTDRPSRGKPSPLHVLGAVNAAVETFGDDDAADDLLEELSTVTTSEAKGKGKAKAD
ncbi:hypothetical protein JCM3765_006829 [Sporobolomyces pararoseus]